MKKKNTKISVDVIEKTALNIISTNPEKNNNPDDKLWERYNSTYRERFDYLTKIGEFDLPMQERNIPLQRRLIDLLVAKKSVRPFQYTIYLDSEDTRIKKFQDKIRSFVQYGIEKSEEVAMTLTSQIGNIEGNIQQIRGIMQQSTEQGKPPSPEEQAQYMKVVQEMEIAKQDLQRQTVMNEDYIKEFNSKQKNSPNEIIERIATKYMKHLERVVNFNYMSTMQFKNRCVTGKHHYMVAKFNDNKPVIRGLDSGNIVYQTGGNETTIQKKDWAYYSEKMSFVQILELFGEELISKHGEGVLRELRDTYSPMTNNSDMWAMPDGGVIFGDELEGSSNSNFSNSKEIKIKWVWFRAGEPVYRKTSLDKYGNEHKHVLPSKTLINKDEYNYNHGFYVHKTDKKLKYNKKDVSVYSKKKGDKIETRSYKKLYHAVVIADEYVIAADEWKNVIRDTDSYSRFNIPIFGESFDGLIRKPYSLIAATNDIQDLIDIIWTSREYMIAAAGTKGNVLDVSQKPDHMTTDEWEYHIKLGRIYIQTIDANGSAKRISYNQWTSFDNTVSQGIQYFDGMIENLTRMMGSIIGIPYQAMGETTRTDQVGVNKMAIKESGMVTELMFYEHFMVDKEALEEYISLSIADADGKDIIFSDPNLKGTTEYLLSTKKLIGDNIRMYLYSMFEDKEKMMHLQQLASGMIDKLGLSFGSLIKIFNSETLKEMEGKVIYLEEQSKKAASESRQAAMQQEIAAKKDMEKYTNDLAVYLEKMKAQFQQGDLMIRQATLEFDREKFAVEQKATMMDLQIKSDKNQIDMMKVKEDTAVEKAMLISDDKHRTFDDQLRALELQVNFMLEKAGLALEGKKVSNDLKKISVSGANRMKTSSNERINDK